MTILDRAEATGLNRTTALLLFLALGLAVLHHTDHVLRVDHSGWPFRPDVTPFTFSLLAYPMVLFALFGPERLYWWRWLLLLIGSAFTVFAHVAIEDPQMQYAMWAHNRSIDPHTPDFHNMLGARVPMMGVMSVAVGMALNVTAVVATMAMMAQGVRRRHLG